MPRLNGAKNAKRITGAKNDFSCRFLNCRLDPYIMGLLIDLFMIAAAIIGGAFIGELIAALFID